MDTNFTNLLAIFSGMARQQRIDEGRDLETNVAAELGRKPKRRELQIASVIACERAFGRTDPTEFSPEAQDLLARHGWQA